MSVPAFEMNVLRPFSSQPPSWRTARVWMPRASEPASGSVSPNAPSTRPSASGRSHRSRWASLPNSSSGSDPIVTWACHAAATDWSARPSCSIAATKPTVVMPMPPHCSGTSTPSRPNAPISRRRSVGQTASSHACGARVGDLLLREFSAQASQVALGLGEREVHRRDAIGPDGTNVRCGVALTGARREVVEPRTPMPGDPGDARAGRPRPRGTRRSRCRRRSASVA